MTQEFRCQHCREAFGVTDEMFGSTVACPHCQKPNQLVAPSKNTKRSTEKSPPPKPDKSIQKVSPSGRATPERPAIDPAVSNDLVPPKKNRGKKSPPGTPPVPPPVAEPPAPPVGKKTNVPVPPEQTKEPPLPPNQDFGNERPAVSVKAKSKKAKPNKIVFAAVPDKSETVTSDTVETTKANEQTAKREAPKLTRDEVIATLLPPKFLVGGGAARRSASSGMVLVPDSQGGYREVEDTVARVKHGGKEIKLRTYTKQELSRRRQLFGVGMFVFCLLVLLFVFYLLNFFG